MSTIQHSPSNFRITKSFLIKAGVVLAVAIAFLAYRESKFRSYGTHHEMVGEPAPDFALPLFGEEELDLRLSEYRGKVVLIDFWATWCGPCKRQMPRLRHVSGYFLDDDFEIITVNVDEENRKRRGLIHRYMHSNHLSFPVGLDDHKVQTTYDAARIPTMILVDRDGVVRRYFGGLTTATHLKKAIKLELRRPSETPAESVANSPSQSHDESASETTAHSALSTP